MQITRNVGACATSFNFYRGSAMITQVCIRSEKGEGLDRHISNRFRQDNCIDSLPLRCGQHLPQECLLQSPNCHVDTGYKLIFQLWEQRNLCCNHSKPIVQFLLHALQCYNHRTWLYLMQLGIFLGHTAHRQSGLVVADIGQVSTWRATTRVSMTCRNMDQLNSPSAYI